jgi:hypothetical protein
MDVYNENNVMNFIAYKHKMSDLFSRSNMGFCCFFLIMLGRLEMGNRKISSRLMGRT